MATYHTHTELRRDTHKKWVRGWIYVCNNAVWPRLIVSRSRFPVTPRLNSAKNVYTHINKSSAEQETHIAYEDLFFYVTPALSRLFAWRRKRICFKRNSEVQRSVLFQEETQRKNSAKCISVNMRVVKLLPSVRLFFRQAESFQQLYFERVGASYGQHMCAECNWCTHALPLHPPPYTKRYATYGSAVLILMNARNKTLEKHSLPFSPQLPWGCKQASAPRFSVGAVGVWNSNLLRNKIVAHKINIPRIVSECARV